TASPALSNANPPTMARISLIASLLTGCCEARKSLSERGEMLLPERIERLQCAALRDVPEGPAVARRRALQRGTDLVDRARMRVAGDRAVGADRCGPAAPGIGQPGAGRHEAAFDQHAEGDARLLAPVGDGLHRTLIERQGRGNPLARNLHIGRLALDPDPAPAEPPRHRAGRAGSEERIEDHVARLGA